MKNVLIIYAHPNPESFNAAIKDKVIQTLQANQTPYIVIDLFLENYNPVITKEEMYGKLSDESKRYQQLIREASDIIFIFPVFWFRGPAILEGFIDKVFTPGFAYRFKKITKTYGIPVPQLKDKRVLTVVTHGAPALPVRTMYVNAVKFRFLLGFLSFNFNLFRCKFIQLWSVPFCDQQTRANYLKRVERYVLNKIV